MLGGDELRFGLNSFAESVEFSWNRIGEFEPCGIRRVAEYQFGRELEFGCGYILAKHEFGLIQCVAEQFTGVWTVRSEARESLKRIGLLVVERQLVAVVDAVLEVDFGVDRLTVPVKRDARAVRLELKITHRRVVVGRRGPYLRTGEHVYV